MESYLDRDRHGRSLRFFHSTTALCSRDMAPRLPRPMQYSNSHTRRCAHVTPSVCPSPVPWQDWVDLHRKRERRISVEKDIEHRAGIEHVGSRDRPDAASPPSKLAHPSRAAPLSGSSRRGEYTTDRPLKQPRAQPAREDPGSDSSSSGAEGDREAWVNALYRRTRAREKHSAATEGSKASIVLDAPPLSSPQSKVSAPGTSRGSSGKEEEEEEQGGPSVQRWAASNGHTRPKRRTSRAKEAGWAILGLPSSSSSDDDGVDRGYGNRRGAANGADERLRVPLYQDVPLRSASPPKSCSDRTSLKGFGPPLETTGSGSHSHSRREGAASPGRTRGAGSPLHEAFGAGARSDFSERKPTEPGPGLAGAGAAAAGSGGSGFLGSRESRERRREGGPREVTEEGVLEALHRSRLLRAGGEESLREPFFFFGDPAPSFRGTLSCPSCPQSPQHCLTPKCLCRAMLCHSSSGSRTICTAGAEQRQRQQHQQWHWQKQQQWYRQQLQQRHQQQE